MSAHAPESDTAADLLGVPDSDVTVAGLPQASDENQEELVEGYADQPLNRTTAQTDSPESVVSVVRDDHTDRPLDGPGEPRCLTDGFGPEFFDEAGLGSRGPDGQLTSYPYARPSAFARPSHLTGSPVPSASTGSAWSSGPTGRYPFLVPSALQGQQANHSRVSGVTGARVAPVESAPATPLRIPCSRRAPIPRPDDAASALLGTRPPQHSEGLSLATAFANRNRCGFCAVCRQPNLLDYTRVPPLVVCGNVACPLFAAGD